MQPKATEGPVGLPGTPEEEVQAAFMRIGRRMRSKQPGETLDPSAIAALHALRCEDIAPRLSDLAGRIGVDASTASRLVQALEGAALVERTADPDDGRASRIVLTADGDERLREFMHRRHELLARAMDGWTKADVTTFAALLDRFADGITADDSIEAGRTGDEGNR